MRIPREDVTEDLTQKKNIGFIPIAVCVVVGLGGLSFAGYLVYSHINNL